ncbi:HAD-IA family hydrolase [Candidatus Sumerlaeota bacterium]|nr:HAD-IA family hydrolase [Candidatus Sumerlaeota bacterium]
MNDARDLLRDRQVLSFDAGFTLVEPHPSVGTVYARIAGRFGYKVDPDRVDRRFREIHLRMTHEARRADLGSDYCTSEEKSRRWWEAVSAETLAEWVRDADRGRVARATFEEYAGSDCWRVYPDVHESLDAFRSLGLRLVVVSNWDARLESTLGELGLTPRFEKVYISSQVGYGKPDPRLFRHVLDDLGVAPDQVLHVGDDPVDDAQGSAAAGIDPVLIQRPGRPFPGGDSCPTIHALRDLIP